METKFTKISSNVYINSKKLNLVKGEIKDGKVCMTYRYENKLYITRYHEINQNSVHTILENLANFLGDGFICFDSYVINKNNITDCSVHQNKLIIIFSDSIHEFTIDGAFDILNILFDQQDDVEVEGIN